MSLSYLLARTLPAHELSNTEQGKGCLAYDPLLDPGYGYIPNLAVGIVFAVIFGLITIAHIGQTTIKRKWWYSTFAIGAIGECVGWAARAAAHKCVYNDSIFSLQISILIISPCFTSAGIYYILSQLLQHWRQQGYTHYSPIGPRLYLIIFISFDLLSIIIQGVGGGLASSANSDNKSTAPGTHIMIAGIIIQLVSMSVFCFLWLWTVFRARAHLRTPSMSGDKLDGARLRLLVAVTCFSATCIVVRNFYRAVELGQGWKGYLITHEIYFCLLDGMLMALSLLAFNIVHPAWFVDPSRHNPERDLETKRPSDSSLDPGVMLGDARA
ncbi:RTA1-domain-containing protein [Viridothelium virens]|uniref:RTA1-domain-containing protein n=1 Tax=Viridothelium virens TaxID=1048519 RepID=A0A6A6HNA0_VIRVR|nr:RTA1-domain-containing protein [Viridothelium virens]